MHGFIFLCIQILCFSADDAKLDEILDQHYQVINLEVLQKIQSIKSEGEVSFYMNEGAFEKEVPNLLGSFTEVIRRPNQRYYECDFDNAESFYIQCYDGSSSWVKDGGGYRTTELNKSEIIYASQKADMIPHLFQYEKKWVKAKYLGKKNIEDHKYHCISLLHDEGNEVYYYLHTKTYLVMIISYMNEIQENEKWTVRYFDDYQPVEGIMYPHIQSDKMKYGNDVTTMVYKYNHVEINPSIASSIFKMPQNP